MANPFAGMRSAFPWGPPVNDPKENFMAMKALIDSIHAVKEKKATDSFLARIGEARTHEEVKSYLSQMTRDRQSKAKSEGFFNNAISVLDSFNPLTAQRGMPPVEQQYRLSTMHREMDRQTNLQDFYTKADYSSGVRMGEARQKQEMEDTSEAGKARTEYYKHMAAYRKGQGEKLSRQQFDQEFPDTDFGYLLSQLDPDQRKEAIEIRAKLSEGAGNQAENLRLRMQYREMLKNIVDSTQEIKYDVTGNVKSRTIKDQKRYDIATKRLAEVDTELLQLGVGQDGKAILPGDQLPAAEPKGTKSKENGQAESEPKESPFVMRKTQLQAILEDQTITEAKREELINLLDIKGLSEDEIEELKLIVEADRQTREAMGIK